MPCNYKIRQSIVFFSLEDELQYVSMLNWNTHRKHHTIKSIHSLHLKKKKSQNSFIFTYGLDVASTWRIKLIWNPRLNHSDLHKSLFHSLCPLLMLTLCQSYVGCTQGLLYDPSGMYQADQYFLVLNTSSCVITECHKIIKKKKIKTGKVSQKAVFRTSWLLDHVNVDIPSLQGVPKLICQRFVAKAEVVNRTFSKEVCLKHDKHCSILFIWQLLHNYNHSRLWNYVEQIQFTIHTHKKEIILVSLVF